MTIYAFFLLLLFLLVLFLLLLLLLLLLFFLCVNGKLLESCILVPGHALDIAVFVPFTFPPFPPGTLRLLFACVAFNRNHIITCNWCNYMRAKHGYLVWKQRSLFQTQDLEALHLSASFFCPQYLRSCRMDLFRTFLFLAMAVFPVI